MEAEGRNPRGLSALAERRGFRALAAAVVGLTAFTLTALVTGLRRVPEGSVGVRARDGALLEPGTRYLGWRASAVDVFPVEIDWSGVPVPVETAAGARLRGRLSLRGRLDERVVRTLAAAVPQGNVSPGERTRAAVVEAVGKALALRDARDLVDSSPFALKAPWLSVGDVEQGVRVDASEVDMVSVESLRAVAAQVHRAGGPAAAASYLEALASRRPGDPAPLAVQGDLTRIGGDFARAESLYLQALELDPTLPAPMEVLVVHAQQSGRDLERAERLLRRALEIRPDSLPHLNWLSLLMARRGDLRGAEAALVRALAIAPGDAATAVNLAALMDRQGRRDEAIDQLHRVLEAHPEHPLALYNLGSALAEKGDLDGAVGALERAGRVTPPSVRLYQRLAAVYEERGDLQRAEEYRGRAAALERERQAARSPAE